MVLGTNVPADSLFASPVCPPRTVGFRSAHFLKMSSPLMGPHPGLAGADPGGVDWVANHPPPLGCAAGVFIILFLF